jgi:hypothetical protein
MEVSLEKVYQNKLRIRLTPGVFYVRMDVFYVFGCSQY